MAIFNFLLQNYGRPPPWICYVHIWTTHEYVAVFITVQNWVGIEAVTIICSCDNTQVATFNEFSLKMLIQYSPYHDRVATRPVFVGMVRF